MAVTQALPRATYAPVHEGQLSEKDVRVMMRGSLVAEVLAFDG